MFSRQWALARTGNANQHDEGRLRNLRAADCSEQQRIRLRRDDAVEMGGNGGHRSTDADWGSGPKMGSRQNSGGSGERSFKHAKPKWKAPRANFGRKTQEASRL
jgi:hypothetical protein